MKAIKVKKLYDGSKDNSMENVTVVFDEKFIDIFEVVDDQKLNKYNIDNFEVIDYSNNYMMPGLIDAHVHLILPGDGTPAEDHLAKHTLYEIQLVAAKNATKALEHGITTLRDCGSIPKVIFGLRNCIDNGVITGPDLIVCGSPITSTGGHTHYFKGEADGEEKIRHLVRKQFKNGANFIKLIATGGGSHGVVATGLNYTTPELNTVVEEGQRLGMFVTAHVTTIEGIRQILKTNIDGMEHCWFFDKNYNLVYDPKLSEEIFKRKIYVCPTLQVLYGLIQYLKNKKRTENENSELDEWLKFQESLIDNFGKQLKDGISFIAGSDAGWRINAFGNLVKGLELMKEGGMSNRELIYSATLRTAKHLGIDNVVGAVKTGLQADFIILEEDPIVDIGNIRKIIKVYKKGVRI
ncbi:amidohydrolase family protein [uncultured Desulfosarcina sp.]|uniref:amidohydrolase family protein n=1 Tax=uncultured Desulfosarcina sp. TaxID=218289 RepID=UPI0029C81B3E|nr:amidohydrolase family protein [uncultured Desulfosarcina sp.]